MDSTAQGVTKNRRWLSDVHFTSLQGSLVCCSPWDSKELHMTEWLNNSWLIHSTNTYWVLTPCSALCHILWGIQSSPITTWCVLSRSVMSDSLRPHELQPASLLCPWEFSRQEYWSGLPCPPPGCLPNPGIEPRSPALQADSLPTESSGKPYNFLGRTTPGKNYNIKVLGEAAINK